MRHRIVVLLMVAACGKGKDSAEQAKPTEPEKKPETPKPAAPKPTVAPDHIIVALGEDADHKDAWRGGDVDASKGIAYKDMNGGYRIDIPVGCPEFTCDKVGSEHWLWENMRGDAFCPKGYLVSLELKAPQKQGKNVGSIATDKLHEKLSFVGQRYYDAPFEVATITADKITGTVDFTSSDGKDSFKGGYVATVCKQP